MRPSPRSLRLINVSCTDYLNFPGQATYDAAEDTIVIRYGGMLTDIKRAPSCCAHPPIDLFAVGFLRATKDVGQAARIILSHPDEFAGQNVSIGHVSLSTEDQARIIQSISGKTCRAVQGPDSPVPEITKMYKFVNKRGGSLSEGLSGANALLDSERMSCKRAS